MKTLIFFGSPKQDGDTAALVQEFTAHLDGEIKVISNADDIAPCTDCRYCWHKPGCSIADEMQGMYPYIEACDNVVIASPIWFSSLSGPALNLASRLQTLFAARRFRKDPVKMKEKNGVIILVGGQPGTEIGPTQAALTILKLMNVCRPDAEKIYSLNTDRVPAGKDAAALARCREVAKRLNGAWRGSMRRDAGGSAPKPPTEECSP